MYSWGEGEGETRPNRLKFRRDTKKGIHKTPGQFISIYFSFIFSRNSGPYQYTTVIPYKPLYGTPLLGFPMILYRCLRRRIPCASLPSLLSQEVVQAPARHLSMGPGAGRISQKQVSTHREPHSYFLL